MHIVYNELFYLFIAVLKINLNGIILEGAKMSGWYNCHHNGEKKENIIK